MLGYNSKQTNSFLGQQKININQLDTNQQKNAILSLDSQGKIEYLPKSDLNINVDQLQPSTIQQDVLVTNSSLQLQWQKINTNNTTFADQDLKQNSSPNFQQINLSQAASQNNHSIRKVEFDQFLINNNNYINTQITSANTYSDNQNTSLQNTLTTNYQNFTNQKISEIPPELVDNSIQTSFLQNNCVTNEKINSVDKSKVDFSTNKIINSDIQDNTISQEKIVSLPFSKLTSTISLNQISDNLITKQKFNLPKNAKQIYVDFVLGDDNFEGSILKPYKYLQTAINNSEQATIIHVMSNINENVVIDNKNQIAICYNSSKIQNSPNQTHTGQIYIKNSQSIKFSNIQLSCTQNNTHALIVENTSTFFCKESTIISSSANYGVLINNCVYNQFQNCEFSLFLTPNPLSLNTVLIYQNSNLVNSISNSSSNYLIAFDQSIIQGALNFSNSSLFIQNSQIFQNLIYSANSPNTLILFNNRFYDASLNLKTLSKSGTSPLIYQNNILNQSSSIFGNTRIYQQLVMNSDIQNVNKSKIIFDQLIQSNEINNIDKNQVIFSTNKITNNDISNDIDKSKILLSSGQENQLLAVDAQNRIKFVQQQQQLVYNNNPDNFLSGDGFWKKIDTLAKFDSANTISSQYISGNTAIIWGQLNIDQSTAQIRYFNLQSLCENSPNQIIPLSSINFNSSKKYGFLGQINSDISNRDFFQISHIPAYALDYNLMTQVNNNQIVSNPINKFYQTDSNGKQFFGDAPSSSISDNSITNAKLVDLTIQSGKIGDLQITTAKIADNAITTVKINDNQITASKLTANSVSNLKIVDNAVDLNKLAFNSGNKTDNRIVCIRSGNLQILDANINPGVLISSLQTYNPGFATSHAVANQINYPFFQSSIPNSTYNITPQISTLFQSANGVFSMNQKTNSQFAPACGWSVQENSSGINYTLGFSGILCGGTGALTSSNGLICSNFSSSIACIFKALGNDNTNISNGTNASSAVVYLNSNATLSIPSSQYLKQQITQLSRQKDEDYAIQFVKNINLYSYTYNTQNDEIKRHHLKQCQCENQQLCDEKQFQAYEQTCQRNIGFLVEELQQQPSIQLNRGQKNVCQKTAQFLEQNGFISQEQNNKFLQKMIDTENQYSQQVARTEISTILFLHNKYLQKKVEQLESRLNRICEILNINA